MSPSSTQPPTSTRTPRPLGPVGELHQQARLAHPSIASQQHDLRPALLGPIQDRLKPMKLIGPADERVSRKPASHARQYGRGQRGRKRAGDLRRPAPCCEVPPTRSSAAAPAATSGASPAGVGGAASERYAPAAHGRPPADVRSMRCSASTPVSPACWLCILPSVRCLPSGWTLGLRRRPSPQAPTLDRRARPPYLRLSLRHGSTMQRPRGRTLLRGISLAQTPPGLPLATRLPGGFACRDSRRGSTLPGKVAPRSAAAPTSGACLVHVWATPHRNPAPIVRFRGASSRHLTSPLTVGIDLRKRWSAWRWAADYSHGGSQGFKSPHLHPQPCSSERRRSIIGGAHLVPGPRRGREASRRSSITAPDPDWLAEFTRRLVIDRLCASGHPPEPPAADHRPRQARAPYEVPSVVAVPIIDGGPDYLRGS